MNEILSSGTAMRNLGDRQSAIWSLWPRYRLVECYEGKVIEVLA